MFTGDYISTIGVDFALKMLDVNGKSVKLQIWDTAGQERFHNITMSYYRSVDAIILVYDVCELETFSHIPKWFNEAKEYSKNGTQILLIGNKCDKEKKRQVEYHTAQDLADSLNVSLFEASAKTNTNVDQAFEQIVAQTIKSKLNMNYNQGVSNKPPLDLENDENAGKWKCCNIL